MDLQAYRTYVRTSFDLDADDMPDVLLDRWCREAHSKVTRRIRTWAHYEKSETITTVSGTSTYSLTTVDPKRISHIEGPQGTLFQLGDQEAREQYFQRGTADTGEPRAYSLWAAQVRIWPQPDAAYELSVLGFREPTDWVSSGAGATPDMPEQFHEVLLSWVMSRAYLHQEDPDMAAIEKAAFEEGLQEMLEDDQEAPPARIVLNSQRSPRQHFNRLRYPWE